MQKISLAEFYYFYTLSEVGNAFGKVYSTFQTFILPTGAPQRRHVQPVDGGVHSSIKEVAAADGTTLHERGPGENFTILLSHALNS